MAQADELKGHFLLNKKEICSYTADTKVNSLTMRKIIVSVVEEYLLEKKGCLVYMQASIFFFFNVFKKKKKKKKVWPWMISDTYVVDLMKINASVNVQKEFFAKRALYNYTIHYANTFSADTFIIFSFNW